MDEHGRSVAGEGRLSYGRVLREALGMFRSHYLRVALVALVLFVPPPLLLVVVEELRRSLETDPGLVGGLGYLIGLGMAVTIRLFGPVVFAGYLDEAVGREYFHGEVRSLRDVLRTLPWLRLVVADIILVAGTVIGLALFVVPGVIFMTLFTLVGPVIVQERHGVIDGFRRTYELSRRAWPMILLLVVALVAAEHIFDEWLHEALHDSELVLQIIVEWLVAAIVGGFVGLVEVAVATELTARHPEGRSTTT